MRVAVCSRCMQLLRLLGNDDFCGRRRRRSPHVGDIVGDAVVGLVAHGGDDRDPAMKDRFGNDFFVEGPKVFDASSAASYDHHIDKIVFVELLDRFGDLLGCAFALHFDRVEDEMEAGKTARQDVEDVLDGGSGRTRDDTYAFGKFGKGRFLLGFETSPFCAVLFLSSSSFRSSSPTPTGRISFTMI